ncbi:MAG TPA: cytochrome c biogenesis protein CcsA, partial [Prolixibacteraceae bacterium]|nr:cytochrome c biogenesis protein CcsA [Prolixibacteraceae bacterium]
IGGTTIGFETQGQQYDIDLRISDGKLVFTTNDSVYVAGMMQGETEAISPGQDVEPDSKKVYSMGDFNFAVKQFFLKGKVQLTYSQPNQSRMALPDALQTQVTVGDQTKNLVVYGSKGTEAMPHTTTIDGIDVSISYGSKIIKLPFSIHLNDFQLERYPGSNSPSSYASEVVLRDEGLEKPFRIFMNNILKYQGYRFFQSSYDTDEKGTILSVNNDSLGTSVTYFGYLIMTLGMVLTLFIKKSRFKTLVRSSGRLREQRKKLFPVILLGTLLTTTVSAQAQQQIQPLDEKHISEFETLVVQSNKGRLEPVATLASEVMRKVAKKTSWEGLSPSEVYLDMMARPDFWKNVPLIKVSNPELRAQLGVNNGKYVSFNTLVLPPQQGGYRLGNLVQQAYAKKSNERNKLDKEIINVDERANILINVFTGDFLTIFPVPQDDNHKWVSLSNVGQLEAQYADFARETLVGYLSAVSRRDWATASQLLDRLDNFQQNYGSKVIPSQTKIKLEVLYQEWNIFNKLSKIFMLTGLILLILQIATIFKPRFKITRLKKIAFIFIFLLFIVETTGLGIRWYISGHAPWSNGYESMIFISWATCLGGLIFAKRSEITLSLTTVLAGLTLLVAGFSWMSPELTNLVPVLKSYWLIVHVAIITASYGFLGIGALLGLLNLILMISRNSGNKARVNFTIRELVHITQIALIVGLFMLTIGSFLGGVWANESWGRYWGWDPKETWALVTIIVYTFVGHMHKIPGFKGNFALSAGSLLAFSSVLMTYFGVNYYLSGLHSYAQGEPAPIPTGVYVAIVIVLILVFAAFTSERKMKDTTPETDID